MIPPTRRPMRDAQDRGAASAGIADRLVDRLLAAARAAPPRPPRRFHAPVPPARWTSGDRARDV